MSISRSSSSFSSVGALFISNLTEFMPVRFSSLGTPPAFDMTGLFVRDLCIEVRAPGWDVIISLMSNYCSPCYLAKYSIAALRLSNCSDIKLVRSKGNLGKSESGFFDPCCVSSFVSLLCGASTEPSRRRMDDAFDFRSAIGGFAAAFVTCRFYYPLCSPSCSFYFLFNFRPSNI